MSTVDELLFAKDSEVTHPDRLYEIYRYGLITRHICANGRVDETTWLREVLNGDDTSAVPPSSIRERAEMCRAVGLPDAQRTIKWQPMMASSKHRAQLRLVSFGGGDNSLLRGGLALALFSLEARVRNGKRVSAHSALYARHVFEFLCDCEFRGSGFFLRKESDRTRTKYASTDEMLGLCFGLLFYYQYLREAGDEPQQLERLVSLVSRIAHNMDAHGYWILPYARDYQVYGDLKGAFLNPEGRQDWTKQTGFAFAYAFRLLFVTIAGVKTSARWDRDEFKKYFHSDNHVAWGNTIHDKALIDLWTVAAVAVEGTAPKAWDYVKAGLAGAAIGGAVGGLVGAIVGTGGAIGGLAVVDANLTVDEEAFFVNSCKLFATAFHAPSGILDAVANVWRVVYNPAKEIPYYNCHLLALAGIIAAECGASDQTKREFGDCMTALLDHPYGRENSLFAILSCRFGICSSNRVSEGLALLQRAQPDGNHVFQHDLPLNYLEFVRALCAVEDHPKLCAAVSGHLAQPESVWREALRALQPVYDPNPNERWGGSRTWEQRYPDHVAREWELDPEKIESYGIPELVGEMLHSSRATTMESCGIDFLYVRMLAAHFHYINVPTLEHDKLWSVLPYFGACPPRNPPTLSVSASRHAVERSQKRLVALNWKNDGHTEPGEYDSKSGLFKGPGIQFGREGYIQGKIFRGRRVFVYSLEQELPLELTVGVSGPDGWAYYLEIQPLANSTGVGWSPVAADSRRGLAGFTAVEQAAGGNNVTRIDAHRMRGLLAASTCFVSIHARFASRYPMAATSKSSYVISDVGHRVYQLNAIPSETPFRFLFNTHQGTLHDIRSGAPSHFASALRAFNGVILPIHGETPPTLDQLREVLRTYRIGTDLPRRDCYRLADGQVYPPEPLRSTLAKDPEARVRYERVNTRSLRLCTKCFGS